MRYIDLFEEISDKLRIWFGNSKVIDKNGNPLVMYHGTKREFDEFLPWTHFGTSKAANERLKDLSGPMYTGKRNKYDSRIIPVYLRIENPLRVSDKDTNDEATLLNSFIRKEISVGLDTDYARKHGTMAALSQIGYDGLVYRNSIEDQGKDSWIIFNPKQARSIFSF